MEKANADRMQTGCGRGMASRSGGRAEGRSADIRAVLECLALGRGG